MIRYIKHKDINKSKWDYCIDNSHNNLFYACSWYLDIVSPNWDAMVNDDYVSVMPLTHRKKYGISYICQPLMCQQLGVFSTINKEAFYVDDFLNAIPKKFRLIEIAFNSMNLITELPGERIVTEGVNFELPLNKPYNTIYSQYFKSHIKNINKVSPGELLIETHKHSFSDFIRFKLESIFTKNIEFNRNDKNSYNNILKEFSDRNQLKIYIAKNKSNAVLGGICFFYIKNRILFQSFSNDIGKKFSIGYYLIDLFIKEHAGQNLVLDFMGSNIDSIAYRNEGFGSTKTFYKLVKITRLPKFLRILKKIWDRCKALLT